MEEHIADAKESHAARRTSGIAGMFPFLQRTSMDVDHDNSRASDRPRKNGPSGGKVKPGRHRRNASGDLHTPGEPPSPLSVGPDSPLALASTSSPLPGGITDTLALSQGWPGASPSPISTGTPTHRSGNLFSKLLSKKKHSHKGGSSSPAVPSSPTLAGATPAHGSNLSLSCSGSGSGSYGARSQSPVDSPCLGNAAAAADSTTPLCFNKQPLNGSAAAKPASSDDAEFGSCYSEVMHSPNVSYQDGACYGGDTLDLRQAMVYGPHGDISPMVAMRQDLPDVFTPGFNQLLGQGQQQSEPGTPMDNTTMLEPTVALLTSTQLAQAGCMYEAPAMLFGGSAAAAEHEEQDNKSEPAASDSAASMPGPTSASPETLKRVAGRSPEAACSARQQQAPEPEEVVTQAQVVTPAEQPAAAEASSPSAVGKEKEESEAVEPVAAEDVQLDISGSVAEAPLAAADPPVVVETQVAAEPAASVVVALPPEAGAERQAVNQDEAPQVLSKPAAPAVAADRTPSTMQDMDMQALPAAAPESPDPADAVEAVTAAVPQTTTSTAAEAANAGTDSSNTAGDAHVFADDDVVDMATAQVAEPAAEPEEATAAAAVQTAAGALATGMECGVTTAATPAAEASVAAEASATGIAEVPAAEQASDITAAPEPLGGYASEAAAEVNAVVLAAEEASCDAMPATAAEVVSAPVSAPVAEVASEQKLDAGPDDQQPSPGEVDSSRQESGNAAEAESPTPGAAASAGTVAAAPAATEPASSTVADSTDKPTDPEAAAEPCTEGPVDVGAADAAGSAAAAEPEVQEQQNPECTVGASTADAPAASHSIHAAQEQESRLDHAIDAAAAAEATSGEDAATPVQQGQEQSVQAVVHAEAAATCSAQAAAAATCTAPATAIVVEEQQLAVAVNEEEAPSSSTMSPAANREAAPSSNTSPAASRSLSPEMALQAPVAAEVEGAVAPAAPDAAVDEDCDHCTATGRMESAELDDSEDFLKPEASEEPLLPEDDVLEGPHVLRHPWQLAAGAPGSVASAPAPHSSMAASPSNFSPVRLPPSSSRRNRTPASAVRESMPLFVADPSKAVGSPLAVEDSLDDQDMQLVGGGTATAGQLGNGGAAAGSSGRLLSYGGPQRVAVAHHGSHLGSLTPVAEVFRASPIPEESGSGSSHHSRSSSRFEAAASGSPATSPVRRMSIGSTPMAAPGTAMQSIPSFAAQAAGGNSPQLGGTPGSVYSTPTLNMAPGSAAGRTQMTVTPGSAVSSEVGSAIRAIGSADRLAPVDRGVSPALPGLPDVSPTLTLLPNMGQGGGPGQGVSGGDGNTPSLLDMRAASPSAVYSTVYAATPFRGALAALPIDAALNAPLVDSSPFSLADEGVDTVCLADEAQRVAQNLAAAAAGGFGTPMAAHTPGAAMHQASSPCSAMRPDLPERMMSPVTDDLRDMHVLMLTKQLAELQKRNKDLEGENLRLREQIEIYEFEKTELNSQEEMEKQARQYAEEQLQQAQVDMQQLMQAKNAQQGQMVAMKQEFEALRQEAARKHQADKEQHQELQQKINQLQEERNAALDRVNLQDMELTAVKSNMGSLQAAMQAEQQRSADLEASLAARDKELSDMARIQHETQVKLEKAMEQMIAANTAKEHARQKANDEAGKVQQLLHERTQLLSERQQVMAEREKRLQDYQHLKQKYAHKSAALKEAEARYQAKDAENQELMSMCDQLLAQQEARR